MLFYCSKCLNAYTDHLSIILDYLQRLMELSWQHLSEIFKNHCLYITDNNWHELSTLPEFFMVNLQQSRDFDAGVLTS